MVSLLVNGFITLFLYTPSALIYEGLIDSNKVVTAALYAISSHNRPALTPFPVPMPKYYNPRMVYTPTSYPSSRCRITCFSHHSLEDGFSFVGNNIYAQGRIMVPGYYDAKGECHPYGFESADISHSPDFVSLCKIFIKTCKEDQKNPCWAGGNP